MTDEKQLTRKQKVFIDAYLTTWNATEAARRAGYKHPNVQGPTLVNLSYISEAIQARMKETAMGADEVIKRLSEQASITLADFLIFKEEDGRNQLAGINWDNVIARGHLVKSIVPTQYGIKLELHDGQTALLAMAKRHQLLIDKSEHRVDLVEMTLEEWRAKQAERKAETAAVISDFEEPNA